MLKEMIPKKLRMMPRIAAKKNQPETTDDVEDLSMEVLATDVNSMDNAEEPENICLKVSPVDLVQERPTTSAIHEGFFSNPDRDLKFITNPCSVQLTQEGLRPVHVVHNMVHVRNQGI